MIIVIGLLIGLLTSIVKLRRLPGQPRQTTLWRLLTYTLVTSIWVYFGSEILIWLHGLLILRLPRAQTGDAIAFSLALGNAVSCGTVFFISFRLKLYQLVKPAEDFEAQREAVNSEIDELNESIEQRDSEIEDLQGQISDLEGQNADDQARIEELRLQLSEIEARESAQNGSAIAR